MNFDYDWLPMVFAAIMGLSILLYVILDGYDLGVGMLMALAPKEEKDRMIASIGPRNPFIDHPHFAQSIWGPACGISTVLETEDNNIPLPLWSLVLLAVGVGAMVKAKA